MLSVREIGQEYNEEMLRILLESPMVTDGLSLCLDRSPDIFTVPRDFFKAFTAYGFFREERLVGYGMICEKELYVNGNLRLVGYFANLYVRQEARKLGWLYKASAPLFGEIVKRTNIGFASTVKGNRATETMIGRKISKFPLMPHSRSAQIYHLQNIIITIRKRLSSNWVVRRATEADGPRIAELLDNEMRNRLFGQPMTLTLLNGLMEKRPGFSFASFYVAEKEGKMVGVCSAWDISALRNTRVMEYRKMYRAVKIGYSIMGPLLGFPPLPKPGGPFREMIVSEFAAEPRIPEILEALLLSVYRDCRQAGYNMIEVASYEGDPMLRATRPFFTQPVYSHIVVGTAEEDLIEREGIDISRPYCDIALT